MYLDEQPDGLTIRRDANGELVLLRISAVLTSDGLNIADPECPLLYCAREEVVTAIRCEGEVTSRNRTDVDSKPCDDVSGIATLPSPV